MCLFNDIYLQQLYLKLLVEYKNEFKQIIRHKNIPIYIPIYRTHKLPLSEQVEHFNMVKEFEDEDIFFNFFDHDFEDYKFEDPNLNDILQNAISMLEITGENLTQHKRITLHNLKDTIRQVEYNTSNDETPFEAPLKLKQKIELLRKLYRIENKRTATQNPITQTTYHIVCKFFLRRFTVIYLLTSLNLYDIL